MRLRIARNYPALVALFGLSMHAAMLEDRAVIWFADMGNGELAAE